VKVTEVPVQTGLAETEMVTETGVELTVMVRMFEVAGLPAGQDRLDVRMTDTRSLFAGVYVNVGLLAPVLRPLTFHWYAGLDPPFTGVAVKVTEVPRQTGLAEAEMPTETGR